LRLTVKDAGSGGRISMRPVTNAKWMMLVVPTSAGTPG
jgi:hypothetical protein